MSDDIDPRSGPSFGWAAFHELAARRGEGLLLGFQEALERDRLDHWRATLSGGGARPADVGEEPVPGGAKIIHIDFTRRIRRRRKA